MRIVLDISYVFMRILLDISEMNARESESI